jgi:tRNA(Ile)-lysidine synthetase-like protein
MRHQLIPLAQSRNPELLATIAQSLDNLGCDDALLSRMAAALEDKLVSEHNSIISIAPELFSEDQALVRRVIHSVCARILPDGQRITAAHIVQIAEQGHNVGFVTVIPGAVMVANEYGRLVFWRKNDVCGHQPGSEGHRPMDCPQWQAVLEPACPQLLPDGRRIELAEVEPGQFRSDPVGYARRHASASRVFIDGEVVRLSGGRLTVSRWQQGDRLCPLGMGGQHRLVSDLLIDRKVPRRLRRDVFKLTGTAVGAGPVGAHAGSPASPGSPADGAAVGSKATVAAPTGSVGNIIWLIGVLLDERSKVRSETTSMFSIIVTEQDNE